jgi:hypothetical protein
LGALGNTGVQGLFPPFLAVAGSHIGEVLQERGVGMEGTVSDKARLLLKLSAALVVFGDDVPGEGRETV